MLARFALASAALAAVSVLAACASHMSGYPKYVRSQPAPTGKLVSPPVATAVFLPESSWQFSSEGGPWNPNFRLRIDAEDVAPPAIARDGLQPIGDVRTSDVRIDGATYHRLYCGWSWQAPDHEDGPCESHRQPADRSKTFALVQDAMSHLAAEAAAHGAVAVVDARCFAWSDGPRLWCEGTAVR